MLDHFFSAVKPTCPRPNWSWKFGHTDYLHNNETALGASNCYEAYG